MASSSLEEFEALRFWEFPELASERWSEPITSAER